MDAVLCLVRPLHFLLQFDDVFKIRLRIYLRNKICLRYYEKETFYGSQSASREKNERQANVCSWFIRSDHNRFSFADVHECALGDRTLMAGCRAVPNADGVDWILSWLHIDDGGAQRRVELGLSDYALRQTCCSPPI